ncbi:MAG: septum formation initiator family protein, partial [Egibacteraceae bacterium]
ASLRAPSLTVRTLGWVGQGERIYLLAALCLALLLGVTAIGPVKSYAAAGDRVEQLVQRRTDLQAEVDRLEELRLRLGDPKEIELLAREQFGLVRPGEIPYVVVHPGRQPNELPLATQDPPPTPWYHRLLSTLRQAFA